MYHFRYVSKNEIAPLKNQVIELIGLVQDEIRKYFTFQYEFIGSVKRNMVTCDAKSNIGFDFDVPRGSAEFLQTGKQITMPQVFQGCWRYFKTERIRSGAACQPLLFQPFKQFLKLRGRRFYRADSGKIVKFAVQVNIGVSRK